MFFISIIFLIVKLQTVTFCKFSFHYVFQLDFQLPQRFNLSYSAEDESKRERPVMIHRAILGSVERMFAILLEHFKGKWPFWLSPRQAMVCPVSDKSQAYGMEVCIVVYSRYAFLTCYIMLL